MRLTIKLVTCSFVVIRIAPQIVANRLSVIKMWWCRSMSAATASSGMHVHWMPTYYTRLFFTYSVRIHPYTCTVFECSGSFAYIRMYGVKMAKNTDPGKYAHSTHVKARVLKDRPAWERRVVWVRGPQIVDSHFRGTPSLEMTQF